MARLIELTLNGRRRIDAVPDNRLLLDYLRETVGLTGTKTGCDGGECGACTVLVDDDADAVLPDAGGDGGRQARRHRRSRSATAAPCRPCSAAFTRSSAPNAAIARRASSWRPPACCAAIRSPSEDEIRAALGSNICRCTGYVKIIEAVQHASAACWRRPARTASP